MFVVPLLRCKILIIGGGTGGCSLAAKLSSHFGKNKVIVVEPADKHYYQPMFTLIGGGMKTLNSSYKPMDKVIPKLVKLIKDRAISFDLENNSVTTLNGRTINYEVLLLATGLQLNYDKIPGLKEALDIKNGNVCSIYSPQYVEKTYRCLQEFKRGNAIFTFPASPVKCPGAPQKIMYIAEHYLRKTNKRHNAQIIYNTALSVLFGVKHYADTLWQIVKQRNIHVNLNKNLVKVCYERNIAVFEDMENSNKKYEEEYSFLHVVPPMSPPNEILSCKTLVNSLGFINVDMQTLQHIKYLNVFAIGDCSGTPNSKTAASVAAQSPVAYKNIISYLKGEHLRESYNGYASCPLVTGYNSCILAEFDYSLTPLETFPFPQNKERYSMFLMKKNVMPSIYWNLMMKGLWNGPESMRRLMSIFTFNNEKNK